MIDFILEVDCWIEYVVFANNVEDFVKLLTMDVVMMNCYLDFVFRLSLLLINDD